MDGDSEHKGPAWLELPDELWRACISENVDHYMDQLDRARRGVRLKFNVHAFLFGLTWMFFRKMFLVAGCTVILLLASYTVLALFNGYIVPFRSIRLVLAAAYFIAIPILMGMYADRTYLWHVARIIQDETAPGTNRTAEQKNARIALKGGTSWGAAIALFFGVLMFFFTLGRLAQP